MIELTVFNFIKSKMNIPIYFEEKTLDQYLLIEKLSTNYEIGYCVSQFAIDCYDTSLFNAVKLASKVKEVVYQLINLDIIVKVQMDNDYNETDTQKKKYRYSLEFTITHY